MKKFLIQWRKFELKRSYRNEDINFSILGNFSRFYFDFFKYFSDLFPYLKMQKVVILSHGTRGADVARCAHIAEPHEATWMPTWRGESSG